MNEEIKNTPPDKKDRLSRREFLKGAVVGAAAGFLAGCGPKEREAKIEEMIKDGTVLEAVQETAFRRASSKESELFGMINEGERVRVLADKDGEYLNKGVVIHTTVRVESEEGIGRDIKTASGTVVEDVNKEHRGWVRLGDFRVVDESEDKGSEPEKKGE